MGKNKTIKITTKVYFNPELQTKKQYNQFINLLVKEGWIVKDRFNFKEDSNDNAIYNPDYYGRTKLSRKL